MNSQPFHHASGAIVPDSPEARWRARASAHAHTLDPLKNNFLHKSPAPTLSACFCLRVLFDGIHKRRKCRYHFVYPIGTPTQHCPGDYHIDDMK